MDKYKILICGKQNIIIDDFFHHLSDDFDLLTTSFRYEDIVKHVSLFHPDVFILCLNGETKDDLSVMMELKRIFTRESIFVFIAGSREDCEFFRSTVVYMAEESFEKPINIVAIRNRINDYMEDKKKKEVEDAKIQAELEKIKEENRRKHVLVIDDDPIMLKVVKEHLHENYDVATAISGKIAYKFLDNKSTDMILLDYEMPGEDGPDVLINLRKREELANIPIIFLTASDAEVNVVMGLEMGADDYICKPFRINELMARIKTVLRRSGKGLANSGAERSGILEIKNVRIHTGEAKVGLLDESTEKEEMVELTALEYRLLLAFYNNRGVVMSRSQLLEEMWDVSGDFVNDNTLTVYIKRLRDKIEKDPANPQIIKTVRGLGYILEK